MNNLENYYSIIFDQSISPSGTHVASCNNYGQIAIFNLSSALNSAATRNSRTPIKTITGHQGPVYCLEQVKDLLVSGGEDGVKVWKWDDLSNASKEDVLPVATFQPPLSKVRLPETNGLAYDSERETLYCGCGDSMIHAVDIHTAQLKTSYSGHSDYVHCVRMRTGSSHFLSGSEDGTARLWDPAVMRGSALTLKPAKLTNGQWVGCVTMDTSGDWVVCGGSMPPTFFHLSSPSSATKTASMELPQDTLTQAAIFINDRIVTAGSGPNIMHWSINGEALASVPSDLGHVFSLVYNTNSKKNEVLLASGDSSDIRVFTNLGYSSFSLTVNTLLQ